MEGEGSNCGAGFVLGIDLGTTSVKAALMDKVEENPPFMATRNSEANEERTDDCREQVVGSIFRALEDCVDTLPLVARSEVRALCVAGQMHGVVLWKSGHGWVWEKTSNGYSLRLGECSRLVSWEDGRCTPSFLASLPRPDPLYGLATGYGCATLFWFTRHRPELLLQYDRAGTVQDLLVCALCDLDGPLMSTHNAVSWGYYDPLCGWDTKRLAMAGFPVALLPRVVEPGTLAGRLCRAWCGLREGLAITVAVGDCQASVLSCLQDESTAVLNIGTSAQLSFLMFPEFELSKFSSTVCCDPADSIAPPPMQYLPYFGGRYLAVAAALNGGNAFSTFVKMLRGWIAELGLLPPEPSAIFSALVEAGGKRSDTDLEVRPTPLGERHLPTMRASVLHATPYNLSLGHVSRALCRGLADTIAALIPPGQLALAGVRAVSGTGTPLEENAVLREELERALGLPVTLMARSNSAVGAAKVALHLLNKQVIDGQKNDE
uniref:sedoheptulokinase isoform X1 n=1 Tax=Myxine glutinosa TaxID=7769 RepID=UPI00358DF2A7